MLFNPHPPLTGAPGTLLVLACASELLYSALTCKQHPAARHFRTSSTVFVIAAVLLVPLTYYSGYWGAEAASQTFQISDELVGTHQAWGKFALISCFPSMVLFGLERFGNNAPNWLRPVYLGLLAVSTALVLYTSYQGGELVFRHGAAVSAQSPN